MTKNEAWLGPKITFFAKEDTDVISREVVLTPDGPAIKTMTKGGESSLKPIPLPPGLTFLKETTDD
uniref:Uncharacterized protein n=1 Tax=viral metagenome TaxID=1070528 RepID=A0A6M3LMA6_9ZZZZ